MKVILCIPVHNAQPFAEQQTRAIQSLTLKPNSFLVIDSSSTDGSPEIYRKAGARIITIPKNEFNHGATRNKFLEIESGDVYLYLTHDAIPAHPDCFEKLLKVFDADPRAGLAYGRQLPHPQATSFAAHARYFNYPAQSLRKTVEDAPQLGIKTPFCSNSFAAYRGETLKKIGGFPKNVILSEDIVAAARMLEKKCSIHYVAEARVYHSHNYSILQEFRRYFDIGVFYGREKWVLKNFGRAEGEGKQFLFSEFRYLIKYGRFHLLPEWFFRNGMKWMGYRLGMAEKYFSSGFKKSLSMHKDFWNSPYDTGHVSPTLSKINEN